MNKIKVALNAMAILAAVGAAFATRNCKLCEEYSQYIPVNNTYQKTGDFGIGYYCSYGSGICTFYTIDSMRNAVWLPCREGLYRPVNK